MTLPLGLLSVREQTKNTQQKLGEGVWPKQRESELWHAHQHTAQNCLFHVEAQLEENSSF